ncbi:primosomal protein N' (replication factor Y) - superfamily II helicase [Leptolyngbya sp. FACHB-261]|uniref:primosomal protein N' (replication factor Y) - superfamily II helicase n=1 Tax=Leptolyngbya sp. FACHB-261 TaxID=2692806 RepID=UPI0016848F44|nr:primosomal protein N' (replication factor Y) - superfamily II helicase [Leptolyngbya sp. FACHB-261]MBD2104405.1 primosomal protein N' (replication factor Y) - superfamily II helicase [Leptolyngbya sp. FACHB-261]
MDPSKLVNRFPCPGCGADLEFQPKIGRLQCPYCGREEQIQHGNQAVEEHPYSQALNSLTGQTSLLSSQALEVACSDCGASITFEPPEVAGKCPFCAANIVTQPKSAHPVLTPGGVLPFAMQKQEARTNIQQWLGNRWFAPNSLNKIAQQEELSGVYLPFWTYDCQAISDYRGERGEHYYVTETYTEIEDGKSVTKTRQVQKTRWHPASGRVSRLFDDVLVAATQVVNKKRLDALEPWDLSALCPYQPSYLAGFKAQRYQVKLDEGFEVAKQWMTSVIHQDVCRNIGGDEQRVHHIATTHRNTTFKHILLPIWISAYRFNNQQYQVLVNARTGEVLGDRPYSAWKILSFALLCTAVLAGVLWLLNPQQQNDLPLPVPPSDQPP